MIILRYSSLSFYSSPPSSHASRYHHYLTQNKPPQPTRGPGGSVIHEVPLRPCLEEDKERIELEEIEFRRFMETIEPFDFSTLFALPVASYDDGILSIYIFYDCNVFLSLQHSRPSMK